MKFKKLIYVSICLVIATLVFLNHINFVYSDEESSVVYVDYSGSDSNPGTENLSVKSIEKALEKVLSQGTIIIKDKVRSGATSKSEIYDKNKKKSKKCIT